MKSTLLVVIAILFMAFPAVLYAQQPPGNQTAAKRTVTGKITDDKGEPLENVTVTQRGTQNAVLTNVDGVFSIQLPPGTSVLQVSFVGKLGTTITVGEAAEYNVSLQPSLSNLDDVVVVGYGTQKRANVIGAVGTINPKEVEDLPVANMSTALVNKVPGVSISQTSGKPGASVTLRIRNPVTFGSTGSVEPLYVIDGIAYNDPEGKDFFNNMDATMVESITFLKDAAASIYGSRGANGVVLITTKKGKAGKPKISYSGSYGISSATNLSETLSAYDHVSLLNNKYRHRPQWNHMVYTQEELDHVKNNDNNWLDEVWRDAYLQRHTLNVSGGSDKITFFGGGNYYSETGNLKDLTASRYGFRIGTTAKITKDLTADISFSNDYAEQDRPTPKGIAGFAGQNADQSDQMNATMAALMLMPKWVPMYIDEKPVYTSAPNWHPTEVQRTNTYARTNSMGSNLTAALNYNIPWVKGLSARVTYGQNSRNTLGKEYYVSYNVYDFQRTNYSPLTTSGITKQAVIFTNLPTTSNPVRSVKNGNSIRNSSDMARSYQLNGSLNYKRTFGKHDISVMALAEQSESETESFFASAEGQVIPGVDEFWGFTTDRAFWDHASSATETGRMSYLGRVNYSFNDKYLLEGVMRADASPNFPPESRWGYFPSIGLGWKISEEAFFRDNVKFIDDLKIRYQIGATGSDAVANYQYYERYTQTTGMLFGTSQTNGLNNNRIPNPYITWEKALYNNIGLDGSFFQRKFNFGIDFYTRHNTDMLQTASSTVPTTLGVAIADQNYAEMKSWGLEGQLGYNGNIGREFKWNVQVNAGWTDNKVIQKYFAAATDTGWKYPIGRRTDNGIEGYQATFIFRTQADIDNWYKDHPGWKINGDSARLGYLNYEDINGDGVITDLDRTRIAPRSGSLWGLGFNIGAGWKGIRFTINTSLSVGGSRTYDGSARRPATENQGALAFWRDSWSPENPNAKYPVINAPLITDVSSFWVVDGTTMRINNAQLSYSLPTALASKWKVPEFRVYIVGTNLGDIINNQPYKSSFSNVAVDYPALKTFTFGLNLTL